MPRFVRFLASLNCRQDLLKILIARHQGSQIAPELSSLTSDVIAFETESAA